MIKGLPEKLKLLRTKSNLSQKEAANTTGQGLSEQGFPYGTDPRIKGPS